MPLPCASVATRPADGYAYWIASAVPSARSTDVEPTDVDVLREVGTDEAADDLATEVGDYL